MIGDILSLMVDLISSVEGPRRRKPHPFAVWISIATAALIGGILLWAAISR